MTLMGLGTFFIGVLPSYAQWGIMAPIVLGGEYGGAAIYVAEHAPPDKRGYYRSWIQTTATLGPVHGIAAHPRHPHCHG